MSPNTNTILVRLDSKDQYITANFPSPVRLGETVRCQTDTPGGVVEIYFDVNGSPFGSGKTEIDSNDPPLVLKVPGTFIGRCYLRLNGVLHTYDPDAKGPHVNGGGDMVVR